MKTTWIAASVLWAIAPASFAQTKFFDAFTFSLGTSLTCTKLNVEPVSEFHGGAAADVGLNPQSRLTPTPQLILGLGLRLRSGDNSVQTLGDAAQAQPRYNLEISPGYALTNALLLYAKVAALNPNPNTDATGLSEGTAGLGYGLGLRGALERNMFWQVGYDLNTYYEKTGSPVGGSVKAKYSAFTLGLGYSF